MSDYDRSGGFGVSFAPEGLAPVAVPTLAVSPAEDLADGDTVTVTGSGFPAGSTASLSLCSLDPSTCWAIGPQGGEPSGSGAPPPGALADDAGSFEVSAAVWRHLPGPEPGTYVDCALSPCVVRATSAERLDEAGTIEVEATIPAPVRLGFRGGGGGPTPATIAVSPTEGVSVGDVVTVTGAGFRPAEEVVVLQCVTERAAGDLIDTCAEISEATITVDGAGRFEVSVETVAMRMSRPAVCDETGDCEAPDGDDVVDCTDDTLTCDIRAQVDGAGDGRPPFLPSPVVLAVEG